MSKGFGVWRNGYIGVAGVALSDHAREITLDMTVAELADDAHGDKVMLKATGLEDWTITAVFLQDFAASKVDATLFPLYGCSSGSFQIEVGADATSSVSATNPRYSGQAILTNYKVLGGAHGSNLEATATFRPASQLTRRTS